MEPRTAGYKKIVCLPVKNVSKGYEVDKFIVTLAVTLTRIDLLLMEASNPLL